MKERMNDFDQYGEISKRNRRKKLEQKTHEVLNTQPVPPVPNEPGRKEEERILKENFEKFYRQAKPKKDEQPIVIRKRRKK